MSAIGIPSAAEALRTLATVPAGERAGSFPTTHWSVVVRAGATAESEVRAALEALCRDYWYPLYAFARRHGCSHHDAEDCTQAFLVRLLQNQGMAHARPQTGRFRSFLAAGMANHLRNEWQRTQAARRGGGLEMLSLDFASAAARYDAEPPDPALTPDQAFDRAWARQLVARCEAELRSEYAVGGRGAIFAALAPHITGEASADAMATVAAQLGMTAHAATEALHRLRRRLGERLRVHIAETVANPGDLNAELRDLIAAVA